MRQIQTRILSMVLVLMLLLTGCGGGPSEAEGAEPSATPSSAGVQTTESNGQETQEPQAPETSQEPAAASTPEVSTWKSLQLINADTIIAESADGTYVILDSNGVIQNTLPECSSVSPINQYCVSGFYDGAHYLYDLNGSLILTSQTGFERARLSTGENPWGVIRYEVVEKADFGGKAVTHFMRTDTFEDIYQADGAMANFAGMFGYDGEQYLLKIRDTDTKTYVYSTLDGTVLPDYQEADPLAAMSEYEASMRSLSYRKIELIASGIGALVRKEDDSTDVYDINHELCASYDSKVRLATQESVGNLGILKTDTAAGPQTGIFDFQAGQFLLVVDGNVQDTVIRDAYTLEVSAFLLEDAGELHTLVCRNGTTVENVSRPSILCDSATGYILMTSTTEVDKIMIINVDTGEIVSEFQAHLTK